MTTLRRATLPRRSLWIWRPALRIGLAAATIASGAAAPGHTAPQPPPQPPPPAGADAGVSASTLDQALAAEAATRSFGATAVSPDGRRIAWTETPRGQGGESSAIVFVAELGAGGIAGPARRLETGAAGASNPVWSPDGTRLAFLAPLPPGAPGPAGSRHGAGRRAASKPAARPGATMPEMPADHQKQVWVADFAGGARPLTDLRGQLSDLAWSPDGTAIALLWIAGRSTSAAPTAAAPRDAGTVGENPDEQRIAIVDLAGGAVRPASPPDLFVYDFDWSPDGSALAGVAAHGEGDDNWWDAELYRFDRASGAARSLLKPSFQMADPRWSPDGRTIALIGGVMSDQGVTGGDVYTVPAAGGPARDLTADRPTSAAWLAWTAGGALLVLEEIQGGMGLTRFAPAGDAATPLWRRDATFSASRGPGLAVSRDGQVGAAIVSSFTHPPEIWAGTLDAASAASATLAATAAGAVPTGDGDAPLGAGWRQVTHHNDAVQPVWGAARSLRWPSDLAAGAQAQGWLLAPPAAALQSGRRAPLVVLVHGGPSSAHQAGWPRVAGALASQGFYVLLPNPRGSYGMGEAFTRGNVKDFGYGDLRDILAGVDAALAAAPIDPQRLAIDGWSYGGYMTMWAITQTDRFRAAVAGAGVANWQSYYGQNRIDRWMIPFFGASVYDDPWIYARSSPMTFIKAVHTPTLVLQGERDAEVPAPQSYEYWHALRTLGVETRLVIYPDEGHHLNAADAHDALVRSVDWLRSHLQ